MKSIAVAVLALVFVSGASAATISRLPLAVGEHQVPVHPERARARGPHTATLLCTIGARRLRESTPGAAASADGRRRRLARLRAPRCAQGLGLLLGRDPLQPGDAAAVATSRSRTARPGGTRCSAARRGSTASTARTRTATECSSPARPGAPGSGRLTDEFAGSAAGRMHDAVEKGVT